MRAEIAPFLGMKDLNFFGLVRRLDLWSPLMYEVRLSRSQSVSLKTWAQKGKPTCCSSLTSSLKYFGPEISIVSKAWNIYCIHPVPYFNV